LVDGKEVRAEIYADTAKQASVFIPREQISGKNHDLKTANKLFKNSELQILGNGTNKLKFHKKLFNSRLNSGNA